MRDYYINALFPTPIYNSKVELTSELTLLKSMEFKKSAQNYVETTLNQNLLNAPAFSALKSQVDSHVETYVRECLHINSKQKFRMIKSWGVRTQESEESGSHSHGNSIFSGVVYLQTPENSGNPNFFRLGGLLSQNIIFDFDEYNIFNSHAWEFDVKELEIYIFPSDVNHMVCENKSTEERYSIAFDYWLHEGFAGITNSN